MKFEKGKVEHASLDLYFRRDQNAKLFVKGKGEVHLSGYFEPDLEEQSEPLKVNNNVKNNEK